MRLKKELGLLMGIGWPIMVTQLAQNGLSFVDVVMAGNVSAEDLAAVSVGTAFWIPILLFITGLLVVLSALIAHGIGEGKPELAAYQTHQAAWLGLGVGLLGWWICQQGEWLTSFLEVTPSVRQKSIDYLAGIGWSAPALGLFQTLRCWCEGQSHSRAVMFLVLIGFLLNIPTDYLLVYGYGPVDAMGGAGCGWATALVQWLVLLMAWAYTRYAQSQAYTPRLYHQWVNPSPRALLALVRIGLPMAFAIFFEISLFSIVSLLVSSLGATTLSGHQIAYNASSNTYMVPLAIGMAMSVRVGFLLGQGDAKAARFAAQVGIGLSLIIALFAAITFWLARQAIADIYSDDAAVIQAASQLLMMSALFQLSDAAQAATSGALRGYRDTQAIMWSTALAYWGLGLPLGYLLAQGVFGLPALGAVGYWSGLITGLSCAAIFLMWRLHRVSGTQIKAAQAALNYAD